MSTDPTKYSAVEDLAAALVREHHEIDTGIEQFVAGAENGDLRAGPLRRAMSALRRHIYLEETILFPPLQAGGLMVPIMVMLREHGALWDAMGSIESALEDAAQADSDATTALLEQCRQLLALLDRHNTKEEPVIYPRADLDLRPDTQEELTAFLRDGRTPQGWACQTASS